MSTPGMSPRDLLPGHTHIRVHLQLAGSGPDDSHGKTVCGAPPVTVERIELARVGKGVSKAADGSPKPVQLVTCRDCVRLVQIHVLSQRLGDLAPGIGAGACGVYVLRDPELASSAALPPGLLSLTRACQPGRWIDAQTAAGWGAMEHDELWRLCRSCRVAVQRHLRRADAASLREQRRDEGLPARIPGAAGSRSPRLTSSQRRLAKAIEVNPRAGIDPTMAELAKRDRELAGD